MKTLILTSEFPPQPGGIGNHAYNLALGLQNSGKDVTIICDTQSISGQAEEVFDQKQPFKVVRIPRKKIMFFSYIKRIRTAFFYTRNTDTIMCSGKFPLWMGAFLSFFFSRNFIAIIHGSELRLPNIFLRKLTDLSLYRFDKIIAVSNFTKSLISHLDLKNISVVPNGYKILFPTIAQRKKDPIPVLITIGNITQRKGQHNVINALPNLLKDYPDLKYHIVGIPTEKDRLEKLALKLGVEEAVVFFGKVSEQEKIELLSQADVFVMLSETTKSGDAEGFGIAILEANALGIPAIGSLGCGIEDAIDHGVSGKLINNKNPEHLAEALTDILNNYESYSQKAKTWSQKFTWDKVIKLYLDILK
ncbi:glycosyltransferase family 4 protein [Aequorivita sp. SDUM287046]|uniref:Glycosyltransferase family 4 protein n=1 Tax=Aequorivita aurantiaca TaxID=3053356 RepID=A0ABT8DQ04_9FLAO|nr:glycosyltransferase family 4 protein [Aequorivita aurantiaca]MDN3725300.1 glycosyltransferase family 4 protein [Aequorivita aurantiaca]